MATFTEDFTRMREDLDQSHEEFDQSHEDRQEFCRQMRDDVAAMRQENRSFIKTSLKPLAADLRAGGKTFCGSYMA